MNKKSIELTLDQARDLYKISTDDGFKKALEIQFPELLERQYVPKKWRN